jgi:hypothetical protein
VLHKISLRKFIEKLRSIAFGLVHFLSFPFDYIRFLKYLVDINIYINYGTKMICFLNFFLTVKILMSIRWRYRPSDTRWNFCQGFYLNKNQILLRKTFYNFWSVSDFEFWLFWSHLELKNINNKVILGRFGLKSSFSRQLT